LVLSTPLAQPNCASGNQNHDMANVAFLNSLGTISSDGIFPGTALDEKIDQALKIVEVKMVRIDTLESIEFIRMIRPQ